MAIHLTCGIFENAPQPSLKTINQSFANPRPIVFLGRKKYIKRFDELIKAPPRRIGRTSHFHNQIAVR